MLAGSGDEWKLAMLKAPEHTGDLRPAATMPLAVMHAVDGTIEGEPFNAAAESATRDAG